MLAFSSHLKNLTIRATDGAIGSIDDLLFDDQTMRVRWLVVDTGTWLRGRRVLLPSSHLGPMDSGGGALHVDLTRQQVQESPDITSHQPVSRQMEASIYGYYNWAPYWGAPVGTGAAAAPAGVAAAPSGVPYPGAPQVATNPQLSELQPTARVDEPHLRSANEVIGYYVEARDGSCGHVEDLYVDPAGWSVRGLIVDTKNWWPGKKAVVPAQDTVDISWGERLVRLSRTREEIKSAPEYIGGRVELASATSHPHSDSHRTDNGLRGGGTSR